MAQNRYKVRLTNEERKQLSQIISRGKAKTKKLTHSHILLQADESPEEGPAWKDEQIAEAFNVDVSTVERVREAFVIKGLARPLDRKKPSRTRPGKYDGDTEAHLMALACSDPPGRTCPLVFGLVGR